MANGTVLLALREDPLGGGVSVEQLRRIGKELEERGLELRRAADSRDARAMLQTEAGIAAAVVAWDLPRPSAATRTGGAPSPSATGPAPAGTRTCRPAGRRSSTGSGTASRTCPSSS